MVAVVGDFFSRQLAGFDHAHAARDLVPDTVDLDIDQTFLGGEILRKLGFGGGGGVAHGTRCAGLDPRGADYEKAAGKRQAHFVKNFTKSGCFVEVGWEEFAISEAFWAEK